MFHGLEEFVEEIRRGGIDMETELRADYELAWFRLPTRYRAEEIADEGGEGGTGMADKGKEMFYLQTCGIKEKSIIVFSESLDVGSCKKYKKIADKADFETSFGVGTYFTNDFQRLFMPHEKSVPMNNIIKISSANGKPAINTSENIGKNMEDPVTVKKIKKELGYLEKEDWE
ncbi:nicotinate phosphoribosyltransferase [Rhizina undulata]